MRLWENRYARDLRRLQLAWRLFAHEARTDTIANMTGLTPRQIRSLYRAYAAQGACRVRRHRGSAPKLVHYFLSTPQRQVEAAAFASWCALLGLIQPHPKSNVQCTTHDIQQAEDLCSTFELYCAFLPASQRSQLSIEHVILLVDALNCGEELQLKSCERCSSDMVVERSVAPQRLCIFCRRNRCSHVPERLQTTAILTRIHQFHS